ncbi:MAG TPA: hypothetical protein VGZ01_07215, partial [Trinickia sp.]|jgi:hypothetical protein|nr:hypothetical protein [Trinickia sp.]
VAFPITLLYALVRCVSAYRRWRARAPDSSDLAVFGRAILLVAALPAVSIGGNPLGVRFCGVVFGAGLGLMIAMYSQLRRTIDARSRRAPPRVPAPTPEEQEPQLVSSRDAIVPRLPNAVTWHASDEHRAPNGST